MTYQEKNSLTNIISSILITGIYAFITYQKYLNGVLDDSNIFRFWALIILIFIPISIVARIVIMILFRIIDAIVQTAKGEEIDTDVDKTDERDKIIRMKAAGNSMFLFALGFIFALATQLFDVSNHTFFLTIVVFGLLTDVLSESLQIRYYRKGV